MKKGFTLIELLVVISIISLLSTVVLAALSDAREKAKIAKAQQDTRLIVQAIIYAQGQTGKPLISFAPNSNCMHCANVCIVDGWNSSGCLSLFNTVLTQISNAAGDIYTTLPNIKSDPWGNAYQFDANQGESGGGCENLDGFFSINNKISMPTIPLSPSCP